MLQDDNMPVWDAPADEGDGAPRQSYNFAPGYHGIVYRADVPDRGAGPRREHKTRTKKAGAAEPEAGANEDEAPSSPAAQESSTDDEDDNNNNEVRYKLQSMKWGLVPSWTKRNPDYGSVMKTINCRDDSLARAGGMWASMKGRKRCLVVAQGFYEWLSRGGREKVPHFVKRGDGRLMCMAGLWDCVQYEDSGEQQQQQQQQEKHYTYTIITTDSNKQLKFLHDRMPVILDAGSEEMRTWLDPGRYEWSKELQGVLRPFDGELEVYPVSKDVGKVGNNSPSFMVPIASKENKANIANFFANAKAKKESKESSGAAPPPKKLEPEVEVKNEVGSSAPARETKTLDDFVRSADDGGMGEVAGVKREAGDDLEGERPPKKKGAPASSPVVTKSPSPSKPKGSKYSATSNGTKSPSKGKQDGTQKITKFFANSS